jgi:hypothetical protein
MPQYFLIARRSAKIPPKEPMAPHRLLLPAILWPVYELPTLEFALQASPPRTTIDLGAPLPSALFKPRVQGPFIGAEGGGADWASLQVRLGHHFRKT